MKPLLATIAVVGGLWNATAFAKDLTFAEMLNAPMQRLAERVLGEAGKLMMDVERPQSKSGHLRFFSSASPPGTQYGICASEWTTLGLDESGKIDSISGERRYGVEGSIYKNPWTYEEFTSLCKAVKSTRSYFPAPDPQAALTIAAYLDSLAGKGPSPQENYAFECTGICTNSARTFLKNIKLDTIVESSAIDCDQIALYHQCFKLVLRGEPLAEYPREVRIYGTIRVPRQVEIARVKLWIGTTKH